jgi:hypothetical protein
LKISTFTEGAERFEHKLALNTRTSFDSLPYELLVNGHVLGLVPRPLLPNMRRFAIDSNAHDSHLWGRRKNQQDTSAAQRINLQIL